MRARWANTYPRWPPHSIDGRTYELSHLHPFRYPLLLPERPNNAAREVEIRVAFSAHTFTSGCLISEAPDYPYSTGPRDLRKFCPTRYEFSKIFRTSSAALMAVSAFSRTVTTTSSWNCRRHYRPVSSIGYFSMSAESGSPTRCCCLFRAPTPATPESRLTAAEGKRSDSGCW